MYVILQVSEDVAYTLRQLSAPTTESQELLEISRELGLVLKPLQPEAEELHSILCFTVEVPDMAAAKRVKACFESCKVVSEAYVQSSDAATDRNEFAATTFELTTQPITFQAKMTQEIIQESGSFLNEVNRLTGLAFKKDSHLYQPPTPSQSEIFFQLATALIREDLNRTLELANQINYQVVRFLDNSSQKNFYGVREKLVEGKQTLGWGSYFINPAYDKNAIIEVPHVLYDRHTEDIGANVFLEASARGFLLAGAHRNANGPGTADVCDPIPSIFQEVHKAWVSSSGASTWQIHGFNIDSHPQFPDNTQAVLSDGRGQISPEILKLDEKMQEVNYTSYVYNLLPAEAPLNQRVNGGIIGSTFSSLGATQNVQGIYCRDRNKAFVHIELERRLRDEQFDREIVAKSIANSI